MYLIPKVNEYAATMREINKRAIKTELAEGESLPIIQSILGIWDMSQPVEAHWEKCPPSVVKMARRGF